MRQDLVFAFRLFRRQPGLFGVAIGGLTLAIGLSTAIFSIVNATFIRGNGIREPESVYRVAWERTMLTVTTGDSPTVGNWAYADYLRVPATLSSITLSASTHDGRTFRSADGSTTQAWSRAVSGNYFSVLGGTAAFGRTLTPGDDAPGAPAVVALSYAFWKNRLGGDATVIGQTVWLNDQPYTIAGVVSRGFTGPTQGDIPPAFWTTLGNQQDGWAARQASGARARQDKLDELKKKSTLDEAEKATMATLAAELVRPVEPWNPAVDVVGRAAPGVTRQRARSELSGWAANQPGAVARTESAEAPAVSLDAVNAGIPGDVAIASMVLGLTALVVLLAAANVTNVLLANAAGRAREIGTRLAIGASRGRVIRQLLTESLLLGTISGILGFLASMWLTPAFASYVLLPPSVDLTPDLTVMGLVIAMVLLVGSAAGLAPARYVRRGDLLSALKTDRLGSPVAARPARLRSTLIGVQAAASVVLLVLAALFTRSTARVTTMDLGFRPDRLISATVGLARSYDAARTAAYWDAALLRVRQIPGVTGAALASAAPFDGDVGRTNGRYIYRIGTSAEYIEAIGGRIVRGRAYTTDEVKSGAPVAIISASLAKASWGNADPIGARLDLVWGSDDPPGAPDRGPIASKPAGTRVVGVAADVIVTLNNYDALAIYLPLKPASAQGARLLVGTREDPRNVATAVRDTLHSLDSDPGMSVHTQMVSEYRDRELAMPQALTTIAAIVGMTALALAIIGLFGVTAFVVNQRQHEVGVRLTLGASSAQILGMVLRDSLRPVVIGLLCGLALALGLGRIVQSALYGVTGHDPIAVVGAVAVLLTVASAAVLVPALRAARIDPARMLRDS